MEISCGHPVYDPWRGVGGLRAFCLDCRRVYMVRPGVSLAEQELDSLGHE